MQVVVFTDLDGTLLDHHTYSFEPALPALEQLRRRAIPLILCSSKTAAEIEPLRRRLGFNDPFIAENGGGIYIPPSYFNDSTEAPTRAGFAVIALGPPYAELRRVLGQAAQDLGLKVRDFEDYSVEELAQEAGLSIEAARLAKDREFDLPFSLNSDLADADRLEAELKRQGLRLSRGGRFFHLTGPSDKGQAAVRLLQMFRSSGKRFLSIGLGDSQNDLDLLQVVDRAIAVPNPESRSPIPEDHPGVLWAPAPGPAGWNQVMLELIA